MDDIVLIRLAGCWLWFYAYLPYLYFSFLWLKSEKSEKETNALLKVIIIYLGMVHSICFVVSITF
jgi:hypothetical protein